MEIIRDRELGIVGERYASFAQAYMENDRRFLNAKCKPRDDGAARGLFEADDGVMFSPQDTRHALLYGSDLYQERFDQARERATDVLGERYEWMRAPSADTDVHGQHVIVERYTAGHPEAFRRKRSQMRQVRSVEIFYDAMCAASTSTTARIEAGCCVLAAIDALEGLGYETALTFLLAKYSGKSAASDPTLVLEVALKAYGERCSARRMQFPLAAKPVIFHLGCWWAHRCPSTPLDYGEGEGYPLSYDKSRVRAMEQYAQARGGVYLSEDIVEIALHSDPVKVLEHIVAGVGETERLEAHMRATTPVSVAVQPEQGKMFGSWTPGGSELGPVEGEPEATEGESGVAEGEPRAMGAEPEAAEGESKVAPRVASAPRSLWSHPREDAAQGAESHAHADAADAADTGEDLGENSPNAPIATRPFAYSPMDESLREEESGHDGHHAHPAEVDAREGARVLLSEQAQAPGAAASMPAGAPGIKAPKAASPRPQPGGLGADESPDRSAGAPGDGETDAAQSAPDGGETQDAQSASDDGASGASNPDAPGDQHAQDGEGESREAQDASSAGGTDDGADSDTESAAQATPEADGGESGEQAMDDDEVTGISQAGEDDMQQDEVQQDEAQRDDANESASYGQDEFIVALRKRFVRFEHGEYLQEMIAEKMARRQEKKNAERVAAGLPVAAPPTPAERTAAPMGAPRNTPFSMSYLP